MIPAQTNDWHFPAAVARLNAQADREAAELYLARGLFAEARKHMDMAKAAESRAALYDGRT